MTGPGPGAAPLTPLEIAVGMPLGREPHPPPWPAPGSDSPLTALERPILRALQRPPCLILFSGGRDSSALLSLTLRTARREGLPAPIAVTYRFAGHAAAEESAWQDLVARELGLEEWVQLDLNDELDWVGPIAAEVLSRHGLIWPPNTHFLVPALHLAVGGAMIAGTLGDEVFQEDQRMARVRRILFGRHLPTGRDVLRIGLALMPRTVRRRLRTRREALEQIPDWLTPAAYRRALRARATDIARRSLRWSSAFKMWWQQRYPHLILDAAARVSAGSDVDVIYPYGDPAFLEAWGRHGGSIGFTDREQAMRALFSGLVPEAVFSRRSKATFHSVFWGPDTRRFVSRWTGQGPYPDLVVAPRVAQHWQVNAVAPDAVTPSAYQSALLLQAAWLTEHQGVSPE